MPLAEPASVSRSIWMERPEASWRFFDRTRPLRCDAAASACYDPHRMLPSSEGHEMRCLVIEDEEDTARYVCNGLREAGHMVTLVRDGVDGLHLAANEQWDVIILDRMLPGGVDGLAIIATMRDLGKTTPVLILSALASLDERVRGLRGGGDDYLTT